MWTFQPPGCHCLQVFLAGRSKRHRWSICCDTSNLLCIYSSHLSHVSGLINPPTHPNPISNAAAYHCPHYTQLPPCISIVLRAWPRTHVFSNTASVWLTSVASLSQNSSRVGGRGWRALVSVTLSVCICKERVRTSSPEPHAQWLLGQSGLTPERHTAGSDAASGPGGRLEPEEAAFSAHSVAVKRIYVRVSQ